LHVQGLVTAQPSTAEREARPCFYHDLKSHAKAEEIKEQTFFKKTFGYSAYLNLPLRQFF